MCSSTSASRGLGQLETNWRVFAERGMPFVVDFDGQAAGQLGPRVCPYGHRSGTSFRRPNRVRAQSVRSSLLAVRLRIRKKTGP